MERTLTLVREAKEAVERLLGEGNSDLRAGDPHIGEPADSVVIYIEGLALQFTSELLPYRKRLNVVRGTCPDCHKLITAGPVRNLVDLGQCLTDGIVHVCPTPEPVWEGNLTLHGAMLGAGADPAMVMLDALQDYIGGVVRGMLPEAFSNDDEVIPFTTPAWEDADKVGRKEF